MWPPCNRIDHDADYYVGRSQDISSSDGGVEHFRPTINQADQFVSITESGGNITRAVGNSSSPDCLVGQEDTDMSDRQIASEEASIRDEQSCHPFSRVAAGMNRVP